jgi:tetratricopeptide (TPR) repeat protein
MLARIAARERRFPDAEAWYHRAIYGLWPAGGAGSRTEARFELVQFLAGAGQRKQVMAELVALAADAPDDPDTRKRIAALLLDNGAPGQAAEMYRGVAAENSRDPVAWSGLGEAEFAEGRFREAQAAFRRALRLDPNDQNVLRRLAETSQIAALDPALVRLSARERYSRARELLARTLASLERCAAAPPTSAAAEGARKLLASKTRREGDVPQVIALAEQLWDERESACLGLPETDQALATIMSRLAK